MRTGRQNFTIRPASARDVVSLAALWHEAWHETHAALVPKALCAKRDKSYFHNVMSESWGNVRLAQSGNVIVGFHLTRPPLLDLLYVARGARGMGVGTALLEDAELLLQFMPAPVARLECLAENSAARAFYARHGWVEGEPVVQTVPTPDGPVEIVSIEYQLRRNETKPPVTIR